MNTELIIAVIAGVVALSAGVIAVWGQLRTAQLAGKWENLRLTEQRKIEKESARARYSDPLARAAYDLQSRLYNILQQDLLRIYLSNGNERERSYVVDNTTFLIAQYFALTEIMRRDIQYIDLGADDKTRKLAHLLSDISGLFQTDRFGPALRVFSGEQRAIGERMARDNQRGRECVGYAVFLDQLAMAQDPLVEHVREDVRSLSSKGQAVRPRLVAIQNALIDLLLFLDPCFIRFSENRRSKVVE